MRRSYNGKTPYSLQLNIKDMDLVANCPDPVRILELEIMASHSHHTDRANSTGGGAVAWLLKLLVLGKLVILFIISSSMCLNVKLPMSAFIFNIILFGHHTRRSCQLVFPHGTFGKSQHGNLQVPLGMH